MQTKMTKIITLIVFMATIRTILSLKVDEYTYLNHDYLLLDEPSLSEFLNDYPHLEQFIPSNDSSRKINLVSRSPTPINQTINLTMINVNRFKKILLMQLDGFIVSKQASPIFLFTSDQTTQYAGYFLLDFLQPRLVFFDHHQNALKSCNDHLKAFYGVEKLSQNASDLMQMILDFRGTFSINATALKLDDATTTNKICPLIFKDARITSLEFDSLQNDVIKSNIIEFEDLNESFGGLVIDANTWFSYVSYDNVYRVEFGKSVLSEHVFRRTGVFRFNGVLNGFRDEDIFRPFHFLQEIMLEMINPREFFHSTDNKWIRSFNSWVEIDPSMWFSSDEDKVEHLRRMSSLLSLRCYYQFYYGYPDEDFCLFKHFQHESAILSIIHIVEDYQNMNWTCTMLYLVSYSFKENTRKFMLSYDIEQYIHDKPEYEQMKKDCRFAERLERCRLENASKPTRGSYIYETDVEYGLKVIELTGPVLTFPIVSSLGFILNLLIYLIIRDKRNQKEIFKSERIFAYMQLNAVFNMIECLISVTMLAKECLGRDSIFCSGFANSGFVIYYSIYISGYVGECLKTCSILTALIFSIERYLVTLNSSRPIMKRLRLIKMRSVTLGVVGISFLTCVNKIFEMKPTNQTSDFNYSNLESIYFDLDYYREHGWFRIFHIFHYVFNDAVLLLLNMIVDGLLVTLIRKDLKIKLDFNTKGGKKFDQTMEDVKRAEKNTNRMIIYMLLVYLICRIPELIYSCFYEFDLFQESNHEANGCPQYICLLANNIVQYIYMTSYLTNILFYYKFNKPFRYAFGLFFSKNSAKTQSAR